MVLTDCDRLDVSVRQRAKIELVYRRALGRRPDTVEIELADEFLRDLAEQLKAEGRSPEDLVLPEPLPEDVPPTSAAALTARLRELMSFR